MLFGKGSKIPGTLQPKLVKGKIDQMAPFAGVFFFTLKGPFEHFNLLQVGFSGKSEKAKRPEEVLGFKLPAVWIPR